MREMRNLRDMIIKHEGLRLKAYRCSAGKTTIGVGRNLDDVGISEMEAMQMLSNDIERVHGEAVSALPWFKSLDVVRQDVVLDMLINLGLPRFLGFKNFCQALRDQNYVRAAEEMLSSKWASQVGLRAAELAQMMRTGKYPITK